MTGTRHTVTHPDGTTSTRTSKTRTYSHAVEVRVSPADQLREANRHRDWVVSIERWPAELKARELAKADAEIDQVVNRNADAYGVMAWNSRPDLAVKEAARWAKMGHTVSVVEVTR